MEFKPFGYIVDVGHGSCNVIVTGESPDGLGNKAIVIDCGPKGGSRIVLDLLRRANVRWIEVLVLTHNDEDHVGALGDLLGKFPNQIGEIFYSADRERDSNLVFELVDKFFALGLIEVEPTNVGIFKEDHVFRFGKDQDLFFIGPSGHFSYSKQGTNVNACSVISVLNIGGEKIMFPGDAVIESFRSVSSRRKNTHPISLDILVAPHHGGKISKSDQNERSDLDWLFDDFLNPKLVVFSVGTLRGNQYGMPRQRLLKCLRDKKLLHRCTQATPNCTGCDIADLHKKESGLHCRDLPSHSHLTNKATPCDGTLYFEMGKLADLAYGSCGIRRELEVVSSRD